MDTELSENSLIECIDFVLFLLRIDEFNPIHKKYNFFL